MLSIKEMARAVHVVAHAKGWCDVYETENASVESACNNLHDEVSELHSAWRNNELRRPCDKAGKMVKLGLEPLSCAEEELADIVIRVFDTAERLGVDISRAIWIKHKYNATRSYRHGGKRS